MKYATMFKMQVQIVVKSNIAHKMIKALNLIFKSFCLNSRIMAMLLTMPVNTKTKQNPSKVNCNGLRGFSFSILNTNSSSILIGNRKFEKDDINTSFFDNRKTK